MRDILDGADLYNTLMMDHRPHNMKLVVVEGESDFNLLADFLRNDDLDVVVGYGKQSILDAAQLAVGTLDNAVFLVDADFDRLTEDVRRYPENVVATDLYDLYMDAYQADELSLVRVSRLYLEESDIPPITGIERALEVAMNIGVLRFVSISEGFFLNLDGLPMHVVIDKPTLMASLPSVVDIALKRTPKASVGQQEVLGHVVKLADGTCRMDLVNSHDLLAALRTLFDWRGTVPVAHKLDRLFEMAVDRAIFNNLPVIKRLRDKLQSAAA